MLRYVPAARSQTSTRPPSMPIAALVPSGDTARPRVGRPLCQGNSRRSFRARRPRERGRVRGADRQQHRGLVSCLPGQERHLADLLLPLPESRPDLQGGGVEKNHSPPRINRGQDCTVRTEGQNRATARFGSSRSKRRGGRASIQETWPFPAAAARVRPSAENASRRSTSACQRYAPRGWRTARRPTTAVDRQRPQGQGAAVGVNATVWTSLQGRFQRPSSPHRAVSRRWSLSSSATTANIRPDGDQANAREFHIGCSSTVCTLPPSRRQTRREVADRPARRRPSAQDQLNQDLAAGIEQTPFAALRHVQIMARVGLAAASARPSRLRATAHRSGKCRRALFFLNRTEEG